MWEAIWEVENGSKMILIGGINLGQESCDFGEKIGVLEILMDLDWGKLAKWYF